MNKNPKPHTMKPLLETIHAAGASCAVLDRQLEGQIPFQWHHHPEFELTLTLNSYGHRYIGQSVERYGNNDLVLIAPNIPHSWCSADITNHPALHRAIVVWFKADWLAQIIETLPELESINRLLGFHQAIHFSQSATQLVYSAILNLPKQDHARRLTRLLDILLTLSQDTQAVELGTHIQMQQPMKTADLRILRAADYLQQHFQQAISVPKLAAKAHLSTSAFSRAFFRTTGLTVMQYVMRLRIGKACSLLIMSDKPISHIAGESGYGNLSLFNRQFRQLQGITPADFRRVNRHLAR